MKTFKLLLIILVSAAVGAFGWWTLSPLFLNKVVNEELDPDIQVKLDSKKGEESVSSNTNPPDEEDTSASVDGVVQSGPYEITGTTGHSASGQIEVIQTPEEKLIRYLNYDGTNGPDLHVYLSKDLEAKDFISLGEQKGNQGNIIYGVPLDVDFSEYKYVLTWCEAFGVLFDYATIN